MRHPIPQILRHIVLASLPALVGTAGCSGGDGGAGDPDGGGDTTNCGMCGCGFNPSRTQVVPYKWSCDTGVPTDAGETEAGGDAAEDADAPSDATTSDATTSDGAIADACTDPDKEVLNCSYQCTSTGAGYGFASSCKLLVTETGARMVECTYVQPCGRRPEGLRRRRAQTAPIDAIGRHVAEAAFLEAASVDAFEILAGELAFHGAPATLVRRAQRAARDEVRHARAMRGLARRFAAPVETARVRRRAPRSLEQIAIENAIEGCVRETYGALMAAWQGEMAEDRPTRRAMRAIADDEMRHAGLAWSVARWPERRLGRDARARIASMRDEAIARLRAELTTPPPAELVTVLGVPDRDHALAMLDRLERELFRAQPPSVEPTSAASAPASGEVGAT
jgi:hypothetical protein